jgi:2-oxo-4-hydroxy-4-carboxy--5-ureidoimidazoline (OHCU) decarboxylase
VCFEKSSYLIDRCFRVPGPVVPRQAIHDAMQRAAALVLVASPGSQLVILESVASLPAAAINANRCAARHTSSDAPAGT